MRMGDIYGSTLRAFRRDQISGSRILRIQCVGEAGADDGGLRRDFLTRLMLYLSESSWFCGTANRKMPSISTKNLQDGLYRFAGMMMAISNVQERPCPAFLAR